MDADAVLHRHIRKPLATAGLLLIVGCFTFAPLFPIEHEALGYSPWLSLPLGALGMAWTAFTALAFRRYGYGSKIYRVLNRGETVVFLATCLIPICASGNPTSAVWVLHFAHVITCGTAGSERRFNLVLFTVLPLPAVAYFALTKGLASAALVAAIAGVTLYAYAVMSATSNRLSATRRQRDELQAQVTALTVSKERARIARDLHDGVGAELSSLFWQLQSLRATATTPEAQASFDALTHRITQSTDELRNVVWELRATSLAWPELLAHLRTRCNELAGDEARVSMKADDSERGDVPGEVRMHVARIVQEAVRNAIHHGHAKNVSLTLSLNGALRVQVEDDGRGIAPDATRRSVGGLRNIDVRVQSLGGTFSVAPRPGGGTALRAEIPLSVTTAAAM